MNYSKRSTGAIAALLHFDYLMLKVIFLFCFNFSPSSVLSCGYAVAEVKGELKQRYDFAVNLAFQELKGIFSLRTHSHFFIKKQKQCT
jgi:hypothetical protein